MFEGLIADRVPAEIPDRTPDLSAPVIDRNIGLDKPTGQAIPAQDQGGWGLSDALAGSTREAKMTPTPFDWDKQQMGKFTKANEFGSYGADPEVNPQANEQKFAAVQTNWDVFSRSTGGAGAGFAHGFWDQLSSWKNVASTFSNVPNLGAGYTQDQYEELNKKNQEFDNNWHIFSGENPSVMNSVAREIQGTGHFLGALAEIAAETIATQTAIGATFGAAAPLEGIEAAKWAELGKNTIETTVQAAKIADATNTGKVVGNLWKGIGEYTTAASKVIPGVGGTVGFGGELLEHGAVGGAMKTMGRGLGAFTNDLRSINTAVSFAAGNAAGTYQQIVGDETEKFKKSHGGDEPGFADLQDIKDKAYKAAKVDHAINVYAMLFLEKAAFGNILNTRATLEGVVTNGERDIYGGIGRKPWYAQDVETAPLYVKQQIKWGNLRASTFMWNSAAGNYGQLGKEAIAKGIEFGGFNNAMAAIDAGTKAYYEAKMDNKPLSALDAIHEGVASQFTKEGGKSFISGFLQGALMLGLGGAAVGAGKEGIQEHYQQNRMSPEQKQQLTDYKSEVDTGQQGLVTEFNDNWNNPLNPVKESMRQMLQQQSFAAVGKNMVAQGDRKDFHDIQDDATREFILKMTKNGLADMWVDKMTQYSRSMSKEDLVKTIIGPDEPPTDETYRALQNQISELPGRVKDIKKVYKQVEEKLQNPFDEYGKDEDGKLKYTPGTVQWTAEQNNRRMYDMAKDYLVMSHDIANQAIKRQGLLLNGAQGTTGIMDMPFGKNLEFTTVFSATSPDLLERQIYNAQEELKTATTQTAKDVAQSRINKVTAYRDKLNEYLDERAKLLDTGKGSEAEKAALKKKYQEELGNKLHSYLKHTVDVRNAEGKVIESKRPPEENEVHDAMSKFMDYYDLGQEHGRVLDTINMLMDPKLIKHFEMSFIREGVIRAEVEKEPEQPPNPADIPVDKPPTGDVTPEPVDTTDVDRKRLETHEHELLAYLLKQPEGQELNLQNKAMDTVIEETGLLSQILAAHKLFTGEERKKELTTIVKGYYDKLIDRSIAMEPVRKDLAGEPEVFERTKGNYGIKVNGKELSDSTYTSIRQANRELEKYIDKNHPLIADTGIREGQRIYDTTPTSDAGAQQEYKVVKRGEDLYMRPWKELGKNKDIKVTADDLKDYTTSSTGTKPEPAGARFDGPKTVFKPSAAVGIEPYIDNNNFTPEGREQAAKQLTQILATIPVEHRANGTGFTLVAEKNSKYTPDYRSTISEQVKQKADRNFLFIEYKGQRIGSVESAGKTVYVTKDGRELSITDLKPADIPQLFDIPTTGRYTTADAMYNKLMDNHLNSVALSELIGNKSSMSLEGKVNLTANYDYNWTTTGETRPKLSELQGIQSGEHGIKMLVTNNYKEHDDVDKVVENNLTDEETHIAEQVQPAGNPNYYSAVVQMDNGDFVPVQLTPRQMETGEIDNLLTTISNIDTDAKSKLAGTELNKVFIALDKYKDYNLQGVTVRLHSVGIGDENRLFVTVQQAVDGKLEPRGSGNINIKEFKTVDDLLTPLNKLLGSDKVQIDIPEIGIENLKYQPDNANLSDMEASVRPDIVKNTRLTYKVTDTQGQQRAVEDIPAVATKSVSETEPIQEKPISSLKQAQLDRKAKQDAINREFGVPKTVEQDYAPEHVTDIDRFHEFVKGNLPDFLQVGELTGVVHNLLDNRKTVGQFVSYLDELGNVRGRIETSAGNPYKYHEAFHGVFRLLTTDAQQESLYKDANKANPVSVKQLDEFQKSHPRYTDMDRATLRKEYQEEWMADQFDKFSIGRDTQATSGIKGVFNRILNWIRYVGDRLTGNRMRAMFHQVHTGDYKEAKLQQNSFTDREQVGISSPVPKAIPVEVIKSTVKLDTGDKDVRVIRHLSSEVAIKLANDITATVLLDIQQNKFLSFDKSIEAVMDRYRDTYNPDHDRNVETYDSITNRGEKQDWSDRLLDMHTALSEKAAREILKTNIQDNLRIQGIKQRMLDEDDSELDENVGGRYNAPKSSIGGYGVMDKDVRVYIGSTNVKLSDIGKTDAFGYTEHADGTPIYQSVDTNKVYNGMLKLLSQKVDAKENLKAILNYRNQGNNLDTVSFVNKWLRETGVDIDKFRNTGVIQCPDIAGANLFQKVMKGFSQVNNDYTSVIMDPGNNRVMVVDAGRKGPESFQFSTASEGFYQNYYKDIEVSTNKADKDQMYRDSTESLKTLAKQTNTTTWKNKRIEDQDLSELSQQISNDLSDKLGIYLHPNYINFSIVSGKAIGKRTSAQQESLSLYPLAKPIDIEAMTKQFLPVLERHKNPFVRTEGKQPTAAETWLLKTFKENATFDSSIDSMSHTNAAGDPVYNYQFLSYNTSTVRKLNDPKFAEGLKDNPDTQGSWLNTNPQWAGMTKQMMSVGGLELKQTFLEKAETPEADRELRVLGKDINKPGTDFSKFDDREFTAFNLSVYDVSTNSSAFHKDPDGHEWYSVPVSLGPLAEKSTHHAVYIPVQRAVEGGKLTDNVKEILYNEVATEAARMVKVNSEIAEGRKAVIDRGGEWITDYHDGAQRGTKFFGIKDLLPEELRTRIETDPDKVDEHKAEIVREAEKAIWKQIADYKDMLRKQELMTADNKNQLLPAYLFKGLDTVKNGKLNLKAGDFDHNLAQVYVNNYVGYLGISRLMYGDKTKVSKDTQDWWKRMAGNNAQGPSMDVTAGTADIPAIQNYQLITYPAQKFDTIHGTEGESDDGQAYVTPNGYKGMLLSGGKLTDIHNTLLDKADAGRDLTLAEFKAMHEQKAVMNSIKPAYKDMETYLKSSAAMLNRQDTSMKVDGKWVALPGRELLHDRLESALEQEAQHGTPVFIANKSISKGKTTNLVQDGDDITKAYHDIQAEYMRLQTATPMTPDRGNKSTQPDKQILSNQDVKALLYHDDKWQKTGEVMKQYMDAQHQRVLNNFLSAVNAVAKKPIGHLGDIDKFEFDMAKFQDQALDGLKATGMDAQTIELFTDHYNLNLPPLVEKSTQTFLANLIKGVTKEKVPMWKMTLRSDAGMSVIRKVTSLTKDGQPKTWEIVPMDVYRKSPESYNIKKASDDKFYGLSVGDHVADRLRDNIPVYGKTGKVLHYYSEGLRPYMTVDEKQQGKFSDALDHGFGARTPGTGFQSYRRVHWVDRLSDVLGNTAILSRDVMTATGHDYDADSLFTAIPDTYINDSGTRTMYGTADTPKGKFEEYLMWQANNNPNVRNKVADLQDTDKDVMLATLLGDKKQVTAAALRELGLPGDQIEYMHELKQGRELNNGVLTNKALHAQLSLLSGEHVSGGGKDARINRATSTKPVEDFAQRLADRLTEGETSAYAREVSDRLMGKTGDMNGMLGQTEAYDKLQAGGEGIGGVANMIQATAVLNQFDKRLSYGMQYDGQVYDEYKGRKGVSEPVRDQNADIMAQVHVDAPKSSLPSKLNLSPEFATVLTHAVKLGLPMDSAMLYPQTKVWDDYSRQVAYGQRNFKVGTAISADTVLNHMIGQLSDSGAKRVELNDDKVIDYIKSGKTDRDMDYTLLSDLRVMRDLTQPLRYMSRFMRFDTGSRLGSWEEIDHVKEGLKGLGIGMDDEEFHKSGIPVDVRDVITQRHGNMSANYEVMNHLNTLGKKAFIKQSKTFRDIRTGVLSNLDIPEWDEQTRNQLNHDISSYLSIQALKTHLEQKGRTEITNTLNNNLIWDNKDSQKSIIHILTGLRATLTGKDSNYALNSFLNTVLKGKGTDINTVIANTWTRMSDQQQQKVVGAVSDMVADSRGQVHQGGVALFNYLLVKDGGQFKNGSFIRFIPPHMMREWSDVMGRVTDSLSGNMNEQGYMDMFGKNKQQLTDDFVHAYATHRDNQKFIPEASKLIEDSNPAYIKNNEGKLYQTQVDGPTLRTNTGEVYAKQIPVDGDSKQWKGAKAVFGDYPKTDAQVQTAKTDEAKQLQMASTKDARATLWKDHRIAASFIDNKWTYVTPEGTVKGIEPAEMLQRVGGEKPVDKPMTSEQPVVPLQQIEWGKEMDNIWKNKQLPDEHKEQFMTDARDMYKTLQGKLPDNEILEKLKTCL